MPEDRARLDAIAAPQATVADKIRALAAAGVPRADIARFLGKRYQHVRNVLEDDAQRAGGGYVLGRADLSGVAGPGAKVETPPDERQWIERRGPGVFWLRPRPDGCVVLPREVAEALGAADGRRVFATFDDGRLVIISAETAMAEARAIVRRSIAPGVSFPTSLSPTGEPRLHGRIAVTETVLDASAVLADLNGEPGAEYVVTAVSGGAAAISAINLAEVISKLIVRGARPDQAVDAAMRFDAEVFDIDRGRAAAAGVLHAATRHAGLSLADAFCLSLAAELQRPALTSDRDWQKVSGIEVRLIR